MKISQQEERRGLHFAILLMVIEVICIGAFRFIYDVGSKQLKNLLAHLQANGLAPRTHANQVGGQTMR